MLTANRGKYALLAKPDHIAALKKVLAGGDNILAASQPLHGWLAGSTYSLVLTSGGMKEARVQWGKDLNNLRKEGLSDPATRVALPLLEGVLHFMQSEQITHLGVAARLEPAGDVAFQFKALFKENGAFARAARTVKAVPGGALAGLPGGAYTVAFGGPTTDDLLKTLTDLKIQFLKVAAAHSDPDRMREVEKAAQEATKGIESLAIRFGRSKVDEPVLASLIGVLRVQDSSVTLASFEKTIQAVSAVVRDLKAPLVAGIEVKKVKVGGRSGLEVTTRLGDGLGKTEKTILEAIFGPDGKVTATLLAQDDRTIFVGYRPAGEFQKLLPKDTAHSLADDPQVVKAVKLLPRGSQWVFLVDYQGVMDLVNRFQKKRDDKEFPVTPPMGMALRLSATGADFEMVMPAALLEVYGRIMAQDPKPKQDNSSKEKER